MRLWSLHPKYLDAKGLVALWREGLLAQKVLRGLTKGYRNHPQLNRFKSSEDPVSAITLYLHAVVNEADRRGYSFDRSKLDEPGGDIALSVTSGQIGYEFEHLLGKLKVRDPEKYSLLLGITDADLHPMFYRVDGPVEDWEVQ